MNEDLIELFMYFQIIYFDFVGRNGCLHIIFNYNRDIMTSTQF